MTELIYPQFPKRAFLAAGTVLLALMAAAIIVNKSGPSVQGCATAAEHVIVTRHYSADRMDLTGPGSIPACRGLAAGQYTEAIVAAYQAAYGRFLTRVPITYDLPPPSYRALSAEDESRSQR